MQFLDKFSLAGRRALVTGSSRGIGFGIAEALAGAGAELILNGRNQEALGVAAARLAEAGATVKALAFDVTSEESVEDAIAYAEAEIGPIDILVNNAGWDVFTPFLKSAPDFWSKLIDINLRSVLNITKPVLASMVARGHAGRIVSIGSDAARVGSSGEAVYAACKAGVIAFSKTLAREHARNGITFNVVCPGVTETAMLESFMEAAGDKEKLRSAFTKAVPMGRMGRPDDLPGAILFFASDDSAFITGQVISVSGGLTMHG